jgi:hypothetical protein
MYSKLSPTRRPWPRCCAAVGLAACAGCADEAPTDAPGSIFGTLTLPTVAADKPYGVRMAFSPEQAVNAPVGRVDGTTTEALSVEYSIARRA